MKSNRYADFSSSRRLWNQFFTGAVWVAAVFVIILVVGIIGMVLIRGLPHVNWTFLTTTSSILRGTNGILPPSSTPCTSSCSPWSSSCPWAWARRST